MSKRYIEKGVVKEGIAKGEVAVADADGRNVTKARLHEVLGAQHLIFSESVST